MSSFKQPSVDTLTGQANSWNGGGLPLRNSFSLENVSAGEQKTASRSTSKSILAKMNQTILGGDSHLFCGDNVEELLSMRPSLEEWMGFKKALTACIRARKKASQKFMVGIFLPSIISFFAGVFVTPFFLVGFGFLASIGLWAMINTEDWYEVDASGGFSVSRWLFHNHPIPEMPGFKGVRDARNVHDLDQVRLSQNALRRYAKFSSTRAYLRGVMKQEVPLLGVDYHILNKILKFETQRETLDLFCEDEDPAESQDLSQQSSGIRPEAEHD